MWLFIKNLVFTVFVPGTVAVNIPYRIIKDRYNLFNIHWGVLQILSVGFILCGAMIYFWCVWDFAVTGRGTPAPIDAPRLLVIKGLYRYVRNPMNIGILMVILGWAGLYNSDAILRYAILVCLIFQSLIMIIEEPILHSQFGEYYKDYCQQVKPWIPTKGYRENVG